MRINEIIPEGKLGDFAGNLATGLLTGGKVNYNQIKNHMANKAKIKADSSASNELKKEVDKLAAHTLQQIKTTPALYDVNSRTLHTKEDMGNRSFRMTPRGTMIRSSQYKAPAPLNADMWQEVTAGADTTPITDPELIATLNDYRSRAYEVNDQSMKPHYAWSPEKSLMTIIDNPNTAQASVSLYKRKTDKKGKVEWIDLTSDRQNKIPISQDEKEVYQELNQQFNALTTGRPAPEIKPEQTGWSMKDMPTASNAIKPKAASDAQAPTPANNQPKARVYKTPTGKEYYFLNGGWRDVRDPTSPALPAHQQQELTKAYHAKQKG